MTSREIIKAVLDFKAPPRVGMALPDPYLDDMLSSHRRSPPRVPLEPEGGELKRWRDEWGITWASLTEFDKGEVVEPAIPDWSQLPAYNPPDLGKEEDYDHCTKVFAEDNGHFRIGHIPGFVFNVARKLRKLENYLCDLVMERANTERLHELVRTELLKNIERIASAHADAIMFPEDWGTQDRLMIDPAMWREIFKPEFATLVEAAHDRGLYVIMHSCGKMTDIIEDLIECGIDCLQFDQPRLHGIELLSERFGGRIAFWCPVDIQTTLQTRDASAIRAEAKLLIERLGGFDGGFIAGYYSGNEAIGLTPDVQDIACKAFMEYGT